MYWTPLPKEVIACSSYAEFSIRDSVLQATYSYHRQRRLAPNRLSTHQRHATLMEGVCLPPAFYSWILHAVIYTVPIGRNHFFGAGFLGRARWGRLGVLSYYIGP